MVNLESWESSEIIALAKICFEARFADVENDPLIWTSKVVSDIHAKALEEVSKRTKSPMNFVLEGEDILQVIAAKICRNEQLTKLINDEPIYLDKLVSPFTIPEQGRNFILQLCRTAMVR